MIDRADAVKVTLGPKGRNVVLGKSFGALINVLRDPLGSARILLANEVKDAFEIVSPSPQRPRATIALAFGLRQLLEPFAYFLVRKEISPFKLLQADRHLLPEPFIVIHIMRDKLLNVFFGVSVIIRCCDTVKLGLQFRSKMYFHETRIDKCKNKRQPRQLTVQSIAVRLPWAISATLRSFQCQDRNGPRRS